MDGVTGWVIALNDGYRDQLARRIQRDGVQSTRDWLGCDEQTMMRAALGVPLRDEVARRIATKLREE